MSPVLVFVLLLFALAYGFVGVFAMRRRLLGTLAAREAVRRKGQTLLVIAGLMVGTATITAALVAADSVGDSVADAFAYRNWGYVDLAVNAGNQFFPADLAQRLAAAPSVKSAVDGVAGGIEVVGSASDLTTRQGSSGVTLVGFDPAAQRPFGAYTLTSGRQTYGQNLLPGQVLLSRILADKLDAHPGDRFEMSVESGQGLAAAPVELRVAGIAKSEGPGGYTLGAAVFAPLETAQRVAGNDGINVIRISAIGGIRDTGDSAKRAAPILKAAVQSLGAGIPLQVRPVKSIEVKNAADATVFIRAMLIGMSALVVAAGAALVVNLIGMLAEERRSRMGVLRALGLKRRGLIGLSVIEGAIYSLAAGVVGAVVGIGAGRLIAARFAAAFAEFAGEDFDFHFHFALKLPTVVAGFAAGSFLTLVVVYLASRRTSRMTITSAIRNLPEPPRDKARIRTGWRRAIRPVRLVAIGLVGVLLLISSAEFARLVGGLIVVGLISVLVRPRLGPRLHATLTGLALAGWSFFMISGSDPNASASTFFLVFVVAMLTSVFGLTILASANLHVAETIVGLLGKAFAGLRAILRPPLAYLSRRPLRTGLTTGVFAVIVAMLSLFAVFFVIFRSDYQRFGSGYDIRVLSTGTSTIELPDSVKGQVSKTLELPTRGYVGPVKSQNGFGNGEHVFVPLFQLPTNVATNPPIRLEQRDDQFDTDAKVWAAVAKGPTVDIDPKTNKPVIDPKTGQPKMVTYVVSNFGNPGDTLTMLGRSGPVVFVVAGLQSFGLLDGLMGTAQELAPFQDAPLGASMLVQVKDRTQARAVAKAIERDLFAKGVDADSVQTLLDTQDRANRAFFSTIDVLMRMGLVVGILSLGIVAFRIVTERRHVIGVLRALGYKRRSVMVGLMAEATVTATIGAVVGIVVGVTMGYLFYQQQDSKPGFGIDLASIGGVLGLIYIAVLLVTLGPAWRASRLPPAEAVRYTE
jgi:putative ABC transport system permease protein